MSIGEFEGKYLTRIAVSPESFPVPDESGFWFVWRISADSFLVQALDQNNTPVGEFFSINEVQLNELFVPASRKEEELRSNAQDLLYVWYQQAYGEEPIPPASQETHELTSEPPASLLKENTPHEQKKLHVFPAFFQAVLQEELQKLEEEKRSQSIKILARFLEKKEPFPEKEEIHHHLPAALTELGLSFRREKQYELSLLCHEQALMFSLGDERILFNIARTEFEMGRQEESKAHLEYILSIDPSFSVAKDFLTFLEGSSTIKK